MHWQDWVLTIGTLIFTVALIPSVISPHKPALSTSLMTGGVLLIFSGVYATLSLTFSTISTALTGITWLILAFQKYQQGKESTALKE